ncbi:MAG TPA: zf-HC2 domain-containing protein [Pyrinomonadaceae bacterium]|nr:zf-HC2 domain-containing protein [Pyrinomonadaceae bacterium]
MKQETNNEMDLLLRRLGRRQDVLAPDAEDHLDADELSAYAENVLPVKTRARYTEHLAECSRCREFVVQLSASAGVVVAAQADKVSEPSGWRKFLLSLFSPMVLKYAAPALALIVVAAIGVIVLRRDRADEYVSQNQPARSTSGGEVSESIVKPQPQAGTLSDARKQAESTANKEVQSKDLAQQPAASAPQGTPADVATNAPIVKAPAEKPEAQPAAAAEPPPPSPAKTDVASDKRQQNEDASRKQEAEVKVAQAEESKKNFDLDESVKRGEVATPTTARSRAAKSKSIAGDLSAQGAAGTGNVQRDGVDRDDKDSSAETRSVAGRRFRKQGGVWIDTAYDRSQAITNYGRDTESYRALIADEPSIKTIADQLDGEIIVVWKSRAYRIK